MPRILVTRILEVRQTKLPVFQTNLLQSRLTLGLNTHHLPRLRLGRQKDLNRGQTAPWRIQKTKRDNKREVPIWAMYMAQAR